MSKVSNASRCTGHNVVELRKTPFVIISLALLFVLASSMLLPQSTARVTVACPKLEQPVTIDGKWTSAHEWTDASEFPLTFAQGSGEAYFSMKHDDNNFYVLVDFVSRITTVVGDGALIGLDTQNDGGSQVKDDDLAVLIRWNTPTVSMGAMQWHGWTGQNWQVLPSGFEAKSSTDAQNDPHSTASHQIYEFKIPRSTFKASASGFWVGIGGGETGYFALYPMVDVLSPDNWAELVFSDNTLAELTSTTASTSASIATSTISIASSTTPETSIIQTAATTQGQGFSISSIPGFPVEAILIGLVAGLLALTLTRRRRH